MPGFLAGMFSVDTCVFYSGISGRQRKRFFERGDAFGSCVICPDGVRGQISDGAAGHYDYDSVV